MFVRREEQARRIADAGLTLREAEGEAYAAKPLVRLLPSRTEHAARDYKPSMESGDAEDPHFIFLSVKQNAITDELASDILGLMGPGSWVVCLQNGIGHAEKLVKHLPADRLLLAVTTEGALRVSDCESIHTGHGETYIGAFREGDKEEVENSRIVQKKLAKQLEMAGFRISLSNDIISRIWQKLLINAAINPLSALLQVRNGELLELSEARQLMQQLVEEGKLLASACGIEIGTDLWTRVQEVCENTAVNRSSMLQDMQAGRVTEIEAITGNMLNKARTAGLELHAHQSVYLLIKALEKRRSAGD